jgi:hypothetical protein
MAMDMEGSCTADGVLEPAPTLPSQENQGMLPGETSGGVGALPGKLSEAGVAIPPDVRSEWTPIRRHGDARCRH